MRAARIVINADSAATNDSRMEMERWKLGEKTASINPKN